jgi:choline-sulfatase
MSEKKTRRRAAPAGQPTTPAGPRAARRPRRALLIAGGCVLIAVAVGVALTLMPRARSGMPGGFAAGAASGYNVLLITLDTTRADHLGCYGYDRAATPVLDGLAQSGILFADAVCSAPITLPSHTSMLTGLNPPGHGARNNGQPFARPEIPTLAEILRNGGYETAAFVSAFVLESRFGLDRGFDLYDDNIGITQSRGADEELNQRPAGDVTRAAIAWLDQRASAKPFFAWVHYYDPHSPYSPPPAFAARFREQPYDGEIAYMDSEIGNLLQALERHGLRQKTLILAVGDHGESLGDHGESTHARLIYESVMRIPLIVACPGLFKGGYRVDDVVVSGCDVFPTVLDLLGLPAGAALDGSSLRGCREQRDRVLYIESLAPYLDECWAPLFGLRRHTDKYILAPRPEYYDLRSDPRELTDLYAGASGATLAARDGLVSDLAARLAQSPPLEGVVASAQPLDAETRHRLESLGYVAPSTRPGDPATLPDPKDMMEILQAIDRANGLVRAGRLDQAYTAIRKAAATAPRDARVLQTMGKILLLQNQDAEAERVLRRSLEARPNADVGVLLAQLYIKQKRYADAQPVLDQAAALDPYHGGVWIARGDSESFQGRYREAIAAYRKAEEVDPYRLALAARARIQEAEQKLAAGGR